MKIVCAHTLSMLQCYGRAYMMHVATLNCALLSINSHLRVKPVCFDEVFSCVATYYVKA